MIIKRFRIAGHACHANKCNRLGGAASAGRITKTIQQLAGAIGTKIHHHDAIAIAHALIAVNHGWGDEFITLITPIARLKRR